MADIKIRVPALGNEIITFPEGTTDEQIQATLRDTYGFDSPYKIPNKAEKLGERVGDLAEAVGQLEPEPPGWFANQGRKLVVGAVNATGHLFTGSARLFGDDESARAIEERIAQINQEYAPNYDTDMKGLRERWESIDSLGDVLDAIWYSAGFGAERGLEQLPQLGLATSPAGLAATGTNQGVMVAEERARNKGADAPDIVDWLYGASFGAGSMVLEHLGAKSIFRDVPVENWKGLGKQVGRAAFGEGITEFAQEFAQGYAETIGTPVTQELMDAVWDGIAGALVGGGVGGTVRSATGAVELLNNKKVAEDPGAASAPPGATPPDSPTPSILDTLEEQRKKLIEDPYEAPLRPGTPEFAALPADRQRDELLFAIARTDGKLDKLEELFNAGKSDQQIAAENPTIFGGKAPKGGVPQLTHDTNAIASLRRRMGIGAPGTDPFKAWQKGYSLRQRAKTEQGQATPTGPTTTSPPSADPSGTVSQLSAYDTDVNSAIEKYMADRGNKNITRETAEADFRKRIQEINAQHGKIATAPTATNTSTETATNQDGTVESNKPAALARGEKLGDAIASLDEPAQRQYLSTLSEDQWADYLARNVESEGGDFVGLSVRPEYRYDYLQNPNSLENIDGETSSIERNRWKRQHTNNALKYTKGNRALRAISMENSSWNHWHIGKGAKTDPNAETVNISLKNPVANFSVERLNRLLNALIKAGVNANVKTIKDPNTAAWRQETAVIEAASKQDANKAAKLAKEVFDAENIPSTIFRSKGGEIATRLNKVAKDRARYYAKRTASDPLPTHPKPLTEKQLTEATDLTPREKSTELAYSAASNLNLVDTIERLAADGLSLQQIADVMGPSLNFIQQQANERGVPEAGPRMKAGFISSVKQKLGIPAYPTSPEFKAWQSSYFSANSRAVEEALVMDPTVDNPVANLKKDENLIASNRAREDAKKVRAVALSKDIQNQIRRLVTALVPGLNPKNVVFESFENPTLGGAVRLANDIPYMLQISTNLTADQATYTGYHEALHWAWSTPLFTSQEKASLSDPLNQNRLMDLIRVAADAGHPTLSQFAGDNFSQFVDKITQFSVAPLREEVVAYATEAAAWYYNRGLPLPKPYGRTNESVLQRLFSFLRSLGEYLKIVSPRLDPAQILTEFASGQLTDARNLHNAITNRVTEHTRELGLSTGLGPWISRGMMTNSYGLPRVFFSRQPIYTPHIILTQELPATPADVANHLDTTVITNIASPIRIDPVINADTESLIDALTYDPTTPTTQNGMRLFSAEEAMALKKKLHSGDTRAARNHNSAVLREAMAGKGFDSLVYTDPISGNDHYIALSETNVKPASEFYLPAATKSNVLATARSDTKKALATPSTRASEMTFDRPGFWNKWVGSMVNLAHHPRYGKVFAPFWLNLSGRQEHRTSLAERAVADINTGKMRIGALHDLNVREQANLFKAFELVKLMDLKTIPQVNGVYSITNPGNFYETTSQPGEVITLSPKEADVLHKMTEGKNVLLYGLREAALEQFGLSPDTTLDQLNSTLEELKSIQKMSTIASPELDSAIASTERLASFIQNIDDAIPTHYVPFARTGDMGIAVRRKGKDGKPGEVVYFGSFDSKRKSWFGSGGWKAAWYEKQAQLQRDFPSDKYVVSPSPFQISKDRIKGDFIQSYWSLDNLISVASQATKEDWKRIQAEVGRLVQERGINTNFLKSNNIPGYDTNLPGLYGRMIQTMSNAASNMKYYNDIVRTQNDLNNNSLGGSTELAAIGEDLTNYLGNPTEEFAFLRALGFGLYLGANVSSATLQAVSLPTFFLPGISQYMSGAKASAMMAKNFSKTMAHVFKQIPRVRINNSTLPQANVIFDPSRIDFGDARINNFVKAAWEGGYLKPQLATEQLGLNAAARGGLNHRHDIPSRVKQGFHGVLNASAILFNTMETASRTTALVTTLEAALADPKFMQKFNTINSNDPLWTNRAKGDLNNPFNAAIHMIEEYFGVYGKISRAKYSRGFGAPLFQFNTYVQQMVEMAARLANQGIRGNLKSATAFSLMMAMLFMFGGWQGLPGMENLKNIGETVWHGVTGERIDFETVMREAFGSFGDNAWLAEMMSRGFIGTFLGVDIGRRTTLGSIPAVDVATQILGWPTNGGGFLDNLAEFGVPGKIIFGTARTIIDSLPQGDFAKFAQEAELMPLAMRNIFVAMDWASAGVRTKTGDKLLEPEELSNSALIMKALGFGPMEVARVRSGVRAANMAGDAVSDVQSRYYDQLASAYVDKIEARKRGNEEAMGRAQAEIESLITSVKKHNLDAPMHEKIIIDRNYLKQLVSRRMRGPEFAVDKAPKKARPRAKSLLDFYRLYD